MKKIYLLIAALLISALPSLAAVESFTEDFSTWGSSSSDGASLSIPNLEASGWFYKGVIKNSTMTDGGSLNKGGYYPVGYYSVSDNKAGSVSYNASDSNVPYFIVKLSKGTVKFNIGISSTAYLTNNTYIPRAWIGMVEMTCDGEPTSGNDFSVGDAIAPSSVEGSSVTNFPAAVNTLVDLGLTTSNYTNVPITFEIPREMYVAITVNYAYFNTFEFIADDEGDGGNGGASVPSFDESFDSWATSNGGFIYLDKMSEGWFFKGATSSNNTGTYANGSQTRSGKDTSWGYEYTPDASDYAIYESLVGQKTYANASATAPYYIVKVGPGKVSYKVRITSSSYLSGTYAQYAWTGLVQMNCDGVPTSGSDFSIGEILIPNGKTDANIYPVSELGLTEINKDIIITYDITEEMYVGLTLNYVYVNDFQFIADEVGDSGGASVPSFDINFGDWKPNKSGSYMYVSDIEATGWFYTGKTGTSSNKIYAYSVNVYAGTSGSAIYSDSPDSYALYPYTVGAKPYASAPSSDIPYFIVKVGKGTVSYTARTSSPYYVKGGQNQANAWTGLVSMNLNDGISEPTSGSDFTLGAPLAVKGQEAKIYTLADLNVTDINTDVTLIYEIPSEMYIALTGNYAYINNFQFVAAEVSDVPSLSDYELNVTPDSDSQIAKIDDVQLYWGEGTFEIKGANGGTTVAATLNGGAYTEEAIQFNVVNSNGSYYLQYQPVTPITAYGTYTITIPAQSVTVVVEGQDITNPEDIVLTYNVPKDYADLEMNVTPDSGSPVLSIETITITFDDGAFAIAPVGDAITGTINGGSVKNETATFNVVNNDNTYSLVYTRTKAITNPNEYTVVIPAGQFTVATGAGKTVQNTAINLTYEISSEGEITQDFNTMTPTPAGKISSGASALYDYNLPEGWYISGTVTSTPGAMAWTNGYIKFQGTNTGQNSYLITYAQPDYVSIDIQAGNSRYVTDSRYYLGLYYMTQNEDGTFTVGEPIKTFATLQEANENVSADSWQKVEFTIPRAGFIGFKGVGVNLDNYVNRYTITAAYDLEGTVKNEAGQPIVGATVTATNCQPVETAENGSFLIEGAPELPMTIKVEAEGYQTYTTNEFTPSADTEPFEITLSEVESTAMVRFMDNSSAIGSTKTWTTGTVTLLKGTTPVEGNENVEANQDGYYVFTVVGSINETDEYSLVANFPYYDTLTSPVTFTQGETVSNQIIYLNNNAKRVTLTVYVKDGENNLNNATVSTSYTNHQGANPTFTYDETTGAYVSSEIYGPRAADNEYTVSASAPNYKAQTDDITFNGESKTVTFALIKYSPTTVSGTVTNSLTEDAVAGATVTLYNGDTAIAGATAITDAQGAYSISFEGAVPETIKMTVTANYYEDFEINLDGLVREGSMVQDVELEPEMITLTVTVANTESVAIEDAVVTVNGEAMTQDEDGDYTAAFWMGELVELGECTVVASATGYVSQTEPFVYQMADENGEIKIDFKLEEKQYTYTATVTDEEDEALADATVTIKDAEGNAVEVVNEGNGKFVYSAGYFTVPAGEFTVTVSAPYYETETGTFSFDMTAEEGDEIAETFALEATVYTYTLTVVDSEDESPIANATVTIINGDEEETAEYTADGVYVFEATAADAEGVTYAVEVKAEGYETATTTFSFEDGDAEATIALKVATAVDRIFATGAEAANIGGKIYVNGEAQIFTIDGRLVRVVNFSEPTEVEGLLPGLYIVAGQKMYVK